MDNLVKKIKEDLTKATYAKAADRVAALRMLLAAVKNKEISLRVQKAGELSDADAVAVIQSEIKKRKDSIVAYRQGEREDLAQIEEAEIKILEEYLPEQLSDAEIEKIVKEVVEALGDASMKDFGKIMGQVMAKLKGQADGNKVSEIVKKVLT